MREHSPETIKASKPEVLQVWEGELRTPDF
jgi:hypothetical protein